MKRAFAVATASMLLAVSAPGSVWAKNPTTRWKGTYAGPFKMKAGSSGENSWPERAYYVYTPPRMSSPRALVVYLHGTTQTANQAALASRWNDHADKNGFAVLYPEESTNENGLGEDGSSSSRAWAWGRAAYEDRNNGEFRTIAEMTKSVMRRLKIDPRRVYISGLSAGGIMSTIMAASYPDLYAAAGIWAGCSYMCADPDGVLAHQRMGKHARVVPSIHFASTTDYVVNFMMTGMGVSGAIGANDLADDGERNDSVSREPNYGPTTLNDDPDDLEPSPNTGPDNGSRGDAGTCLYLSSPKGNNPCPGNNLGWKSYPYTVTKFGYASDIYSVVVESWYIHGASHNFFGGATEGTFSDPVGPDTTAAAWRFFKANPKR